MAAAATCLARGIDRDAVARGLRTFAGVAHRLERIAEIDGVSWVNDSKATNVASTIVALRSFGGRVRLIAGGRGKRQDFSPLAPLVAERCAAVYLIGEAAGELAAALERAGVQLRDRRRPRARGRSAPCGRAAAGRPCCSRRRARATTSTATSRRAASTSERSWRACGESAGGCAPQPRARSGRERSTPTKRLAPPLEHRMLLTATLCLLAFGAVMVYSASSPLGVLSGRSGTGTGQFVSYLIFGAIGLAAMHVLSRAGRHAAAAPAGHAAAAGVVRAAATGAGPGIRSAGQRRAPLVLGGTDPVPALGADEARAGAVRGAVPRRASEADAGLQGGGRADRRGRRAGDAADRRRARPRDGAGDRVHDRHAADRGGDRRSATSRCWPASRSGSWCCWRSPSPTSARG